MSDPKPTAAERIAALNASRDAVKAAEAAAHEEQYATDLEAVAALENEHGFGRVKMVSFVGWQSGKGAATLIAYRIPLTSEPAFKRFEQTVAKPAKPGSTAHLAAAHDLADECIVYPARTDKALYQATLDLAAGIKSKVAAMVVDDVQGHAEEEKKD